MSRSRIIGLLALKRKVALQQFRQEQGRLTEEIDRLDHLRALRVSEERFRRMAELSQDWYWEQDTELRYVSLRFLFTCSEGALDFSLAREGQVESKT